MPVAERTSGPPGRVVRFGFAASMLPREILTLRKQTVRLHPSRPLTDDFDSTATQVVGTTGPLLGGKVVAAARLTEYRPETSFIPVVYGADLPEPFSIARTAELSWLVVAEANRGKGIGTLILYQMLSLLHGWGVEFLVGVLQTGMPRGAVCSAQIRAELDGVRRMYERLGFTVHDELPELPATDSGVPLVPFSFRLTGDAIKRLSKVIYDATKSGKINFELLTPSDGLAMSSLSHRVDFRRRA